MADRPPVSNPPSTPKLRSAPAPGSVPKLPKTIFNLENRSVYLLAEQKGMAERAVIRQKAAQAQFDEYVRSVAPKTDPTEQISKAKSLLDSGSITQAEFERLKQNALTSA